MQFAIVDILPFYRYTAMETMWELLPYVISTLDDIRSDEEFRSDFNDCLRISNSISFLFIYTLALTTQVLGCTKELYVSLQGRLINQ